MNRSPLRSVLQLVVGVAVAAILMHTWLVMGLVVPVTAVLRINGQYFVFVAEGADGKLVAHQRGVKVGPIVGDTYPVLEGLKAGERLVVSGTQKLVDGAPVAEAPAPSSQPPATSH